MGNRPFTFLRVAFMRILVLSIGLLVGLAIASPAFGQSVGGFEFAANAAADTAAIVAGSQPSFYLCGATGDFGAPTLPGLTPAQSAVRVLTDGVTDAEMLGAVAVDVGFVDNVVVNGAGPDLVVFESGAPEAFSVSVFDATTQSFSAPRTYLPAPTGILGGCGFQLNAGADVASVVAGSSPSFFQCGVTPELGLPTLPGLSADASATSVVSDGSADTEAFGKVALDVGFTDNVVVNGAGPDLAVFESGVPEGFTVAVFDAATGTYSAPLRFDPIGIGFYDHCGFAVNAALVDLSSFGVARLGTVSQLRIDNLGAPGGFEGADLADVRAVHSAVAVPVEAKPGSSIAPINLKAGGILPVALLSTPSLDALAVDPASSAVGRSVIGAAAVRVVP